MFLIIAFLAGETFKVIEVCHTDDIFIWNDRFTHEITAFIVKITNSDYLREPTEFVRVLKEAVATGTFCGAHEVYAVTISQLNTDSGLLYSHKPQKGFKCTVGNLEVVQGEMGVELSNPTQDHDEFCPVESFESECDEEEGYWAPKATVTERRGPDEMGRRFCAYVRNSVKPYCRDNTLRLVIDGNVSDEENASISGYSRDNLHALAESVIYLIAHKSIIKV